MKSYWCLQIIFDLKNTQTKLLYGRNSTFIKWKLTQVVENLRKIFKFRVKFIIAHKIQFHPISGTNFSDTNALIFMKHRVNKMPPETLSFNRQVCHKQQHLDGCEKLWSGSNMTVTQCIVMHCPETLHMEISWKLQLLLKCYLGKLKNCMVPVSAHSGVKPIADKSVTCEICMVTNFILI